MSSCGWREDHGPTCRWALASNVSMGIEEAGAGDKNREADPDPP